MTILLMRLAMLQIKPTAKTLKLYLGKILSFEFSKKLTCLLLVSHKHNKIIKKLCSNIDLVTCSRCGEKFLYHTQINVYEKYTQERADMEKEFNKVELALGLDK